MTVSIALRFIPTILDETYRIMKAQSSRGVDFKYGKFKEKIVAIISLIIPLFMSALTRNYNPLAKRTRFHKLNWHFSDTFTLLFSILLLALEITSIILIKQNVISYVLSDLWWQNLWNDMINWFKGWTIL